MIKKSLFFLFLLAFLAINVLKAQDSKVVILNLKNGYSVKGIIVEQSGQTVKIKTQDGQLFEYRTDEISNTSDAKSSSSSGSISKVRKEFPQVIKTKDKLLCLSIGLGGKFAYDLTGKLTVPPIPISFEYILKDNLFDRNGSLGCGGFVGYSASKFGVRTNSRLIIGARGYVHYSFFEKFDSYGGVLLGYKSDKTTYSGDTSGIDTSDGKPILNVFVGARYFFTDKIAGMAEIGGGVSILSLGVAIKL